MNEENNSQIGVSNNEPINPVEPVNTATENVTPPVMETPAEPSEPVVDLPKVDEVKADIPVIEEPTAMVNIDPAANPVEEASPVEPSTSEEVVTLTPGPEQENVSNPTEPVTEPTLGDANQAPTLEPVNPVVNDQTSVGFVEKKSNGSKMKLPIIIVGVLVVLGALGYFVVYPFVKNNLMATPQKVFETSIKALNTQLNNTIESTNIVNSITDVSVKIDSNVQGMDTFKDFTYGLRFGIDNKEKAIEGKVYMLDKANKEYSVIGYVKNTDIIAKLSSDDRLVKVAKTTDIEGFEDIFDTAKNFSPDDYSYITNRVVNSTIGCFKEEDFIKEDSTITVNGVEVNAKKNTYVLTKDRMKNLYNTVVNDLYNDSKSMEIFAGWGITKEDYKREFIDSANFDEMEDSVKVDISIYLGSKNEFIGFDAVTNKGVKPIYYYTNEGNFDFFMGEKNENYNDYISATGIKNGDITDVTIKSNDETVATLKISKWEENEKVFDYTIAAGSEQSISGSIDFKNTKSSNANVIDLKASLKSGSDEVKVTLNLKQELNVKIADINPDTAVTLTDEGMNKWGEDFLTSLKDTPLGFYNQMLEDANKGYEDNNYNYDYNYDYGNYQNPDVDASF